MLQPAVVSTAGCHLLLSIWTAVNKPHHKFCCCLAKPALLSNAGCHLLLAICIALNKPCCEMLDLQRHAAW